MGDVQLAVELSPRTASFFYMNTDMADRSQERRMLVDEQFEEDRKSIVSFERYGSLPSIAWSGAVDAAIRKPGSLRV